MLELSDISPQIRRWSSCRPRGAPSNRSSYSTKKCAIVSPE